MIDGEDLEMILKKINKERVNQHRRKKNVKNILIRSTEDVEENIDQEQSQTIDLENKVHYQSQKIIDIKVQLLLLINKMNNKSQYLNKLYLLNNKNLNSQFKHLQIN